MPELPEVEVVRRQLEDLLVGKRVVAVHSSHPRYQAPDLAGEDVTAISRRGKYLVLSFNHHPQLLLHLGMTGQLLWNNHPGSHVHFELRTENGTLYFRDPRRFGTVRVLAAGERLPVTLTNLGQEPGGDMDLEAVARILTRGASPIKARLLDQRAIAGVGNYIADEALHRAGLHPAKRKISLKKARELAAAVNTVVLESLAAGGVSERDYVHVDGGRGEYQHQLKCYGRAGLPCLSCATLLQKIWVAGRGSSFCPRCQRRERKR
jgi:formamidopyrimidine-DNA glycosylase